MSNSQRFDEHIKEQFQDYTPLVHPRIWENIVKEKERRKPVGFWFNFFNGKNIVLLTGLLIAAGTGAYVLYNHTNSTTKTTATKIESKTIASIPVAASYPDQNNNTNTATAGDVTNAPATTAATSVNIIADNTNKADNTTGKSGRLFNTSKSNLKLTAAEVEEDTNNKRSEKGNRYTSSVNNDYDIVNADVVTATAPSAENQLTKLYFVAEKNASEKQAFSLRKSFLPNIYLPGCPSIEKDAAGNKAYIEIYGGPDIALRSLSDTGNSTYLQKRKESTSFTSAYSAGLRYTRVFSNGMSMRTGINYSQINEKFTYVQGNLVQVTYIINTNGDTTGSYITTGTRYKTTHNKFRTIDVPLVMGYEMGNGKIHANINAGVIVNAYSWQKGEVLDTTLQPVNISTGKNSSPYQFKTNIGIGFLAGASFYYKLNEKIHVLAEPYFRYNLTPMSKENLTFKQKYNTAGVRFGIRIDLR